MNSNTVKPEKFGHLHLVYHFTVPLKVKSFPDSLIYCFKFDSYKKNSGR